MNKKSFVTLEQLRKIEKTYPTPFYIYDEKGIRENATKPKQALSWNKGYKEYFVVKTMPNPFLLSILEDVGCGTNCSSMTELVMPRACGFSGPDIMSSPNDAPPKEFAHARKLGAVVNLDDITHIQCLEETLEYIPETISYRFSPGGLFKISNNIMDNPGDSRYGMVTEQIGRAFKILKEKGVKHFDIYAFLAGNTVTDEYCPMLAKTLLELTVKLKEGAGVHIAFINLSGGIRIPYRPDQEPDDTLTVSDGIRRVCEEILVSAGMEDVALCTELGRFMVGPYDALVAGAIRERHTYREHVGVDAYAVNLMRPTMYGTYHHITVMGREGEPCTRMYDMVDSLYENNDRFTIDRMLPEIRKGDFLFIHDAGAHGFTMGYNYNDKLRSAELLLKEDGTMEMIRRAETPEDYFATFDFCDILRGIE